MGIEEPKVEIVMDWNALKNFIAIAETGTLSGAAKRLGVNHSTVFRRLQSFEEEIGGRLFDKVDHRYVLTPLGEELKEYGLNINAAFDDIERKIAGKDFLPKGTVKITAPLNLAIRFLPAALAQFRLDFPDITIEVLASNQEVNMNSRIADVAIRATPSPPEHLIGRQIATIPWGMYASEGYLEKYPAPENMDALHEHVLIGGAGQMLNLPAFVWLEQHYNKFIATRCDELTAMAAFAREGQGLAFLPADQGDNQLRYIGEFTPGRASKLWVLTHPDLRKTERVKLVMQYLTSYFSQLHFQGMLFK
ncbi:HTH-type transcriptional activator CmpR [Thalassocella blandensis]|nr:HTH-type transcriptional activator CmpR [Thalassocella blandensis]